MIKEIIGTVAVLLFGLAIALGATELLVRVFESRQGKAKAWSARPKYYYAAEGSQTLQDYAYAPKKPAGVFRVAVVGDSYTFAPYMQFTDAFPKKLEQMLNLQERGRAARAEVINYGVPGYSTSHEVASVEKALAQGADVILLQVTLNDPELKPYVPTGIREFGRFGAFTSQQAAYIGKTYLGDTAAALLPHWRTYMFVRSRLHNAATYQEYIKYFNDLFENSHSYEVFARSLRQIGEACRAKKVPIVAFVFPLFGVPIDERYPFTSIHQKAAQALQVAGIEPIDLAELYRGIPIEQMQVIPGGDRHPNEIAHRMAAEEMYEQLAQRKLLPEKLLIKRTSKSRTGLAVTSVVPKGAISR